MKKQEITRFKNYYLDYLKNNNSNSNICEWLKNAVDFEEPDLSQPKLTDDDLYR